MAQGRKEKSHIFMNEAASNEWVLFTISETLCLPSAKEPMHLEPER